MISLRPYQEKCLSKIVEHFSIHNKQLIQLPTGAGKTVLFWAFLYKYCKSALIVVPSVQLAEQVKEQAENWISLSRLSLNIGDYKSRNIRDFHIVSSAYMSHPKNIEKLNKHHFDVLVIDEAHRSRADSFYENLQNLSCHKKLLGLTATPFRGDQKDLMPIFDFLTYSSTIGDLIQEGYLCDLEGIRIKSNINIKSNIGGRNRDFSTGSLYKELAVPERNNLIKDVFKKHCSNLKTLIFCINIQHCIEMEKLLKEEGMKAKAIYGSLPLVERKRILGAFKEGDYQVLLNAQLLTEGFDEPSIEALILARPTASKVLYMQMVGRGTRLYPGKSICKVIDIVDNYYRLNTFLSLVLPDLSLEFTNKDFGKGKRLSDLWKEKDKLELELKGYEEEPIDIVEKVFKDWLSELCPSFIDCEFPEWTTLGEALFLKWKNHQLRIMHGCDRKKR